MQRLIWTFKQRALLIIPFFILSVMAITEAKAMSNESVLGWCEPYAKSSFKAKNEEDFWCVAVFSTHISTKSDTCLILKRFPNGVDRKILPYIASAQPSVNSAIQAFLNWVRKNPKEWSSPFSTASYQWLSKNWPCEL